MTVELDRLTAARLLDGRVGTWPGVSSWAVLWRLERARVTDRQANRDKAIAAYRWVADVWRHADPELQPYVQEAQRRLEALTAERVRGP